MEMKSCGSFPLLVAYFDLDEDRDTVERIEFLLRDETLVAVVRIRPDGNSVYILQPGGQVHKYDSVEEANKAEPPCDAARKLLDNRMRTSL